jgi:pyruvate dehydrogenase kinase 2/3/4
MRPANKDSRILTQTTQNPSVKKGQYRSAPERNGNGNGNGMTTSFGADHALDRKPSSGRRYYVAADDSEDWPLELKMYNTKFAQTLEKIKRRHDSVVTTVGESTK